MENQNRFPKSLLVINGEASQEMSGSFSIEISEECFLDPYRMGNILKIDKKVIVGKTLSINCKILILGCGGFFIKGDRHEYDVTYIGPTSFTSIINKEKGVIITNTRVSELS